MKIRQQKELSESIIAKIQKELENPKVLQQILQQSVTDVESKRLQFYHHRKSTDQLNRNCRVQSTIDEGRIQDQTADFLLSPVLFINLLCHSQTSILSQFIKVFCLTA